MTRLREEDRAVIRDQSADAALTRNGHVTSEVAAKPALMRAGAAAEGLVPANEPDRLAAIRRYDILDTPPDGAFDRITAIAARLFNVPISIISIVDHDRIWFKSHHGVDATEIGRDPGLCASAILRDEPRILPDAKRDVHALANPLVAGEFGLRFYAGVPLRTPDGFNLGTLCVIDKEPREVSAEEIAHLDDLASVVMDQLELRRAARRALSAKDALVEDLAHREERFRTVITSSPLAILTIDADARVHLWNAAAEKLLGWTEAEVLGKIVPFIPDGRLAECISCRDTAMHGKIFAIETQRLRRDGSLIDVSLTAAPLRDAHGEIVEVLVMIEDISERKKTEEALKHRDSEFLALADNISQLVWMARPDGSIFWYNNRWYDYTGTSLEAMQDWGWREVHHPDHVDRVIEEVRRNWSAGAAWEGTYLLRSANGEWRWFLTRAEPIRNETGEIVRWFGTNTDMTKQREAEEALRKSETDLRLVLDSAADGFYGVDREGTTTTCNAAFLRMLGFDRAEDAIGKKLHDIIHHSHPDGSRYPKEQCHIYRTAQTGQPAHVDNELFFRLDGSSFPVEYWSYPIVRNGELRGAVTTFVDITERKTAEAALRESEHRFRTMSDNIAQLAWTCDRLGDVTWYNQRWLDYTGLTFEEMKDWGWKQVQHPDHVDRVVASVTRSRDTGEIWKDTFPLRGKDGNYRWFLSRAVPIRDAAGNVVRWFGTNTDVTELRDAEARQQLLINELNHRVKNTLATVQSIAAQTFRAANLDSSVRDNFEARLVALSNAHSILTQESWEGAEIHDILARTLEPHADPERLRMQGPPIRLSPKAALAISMGMHELATNAVKYGALSNGTGQVAVTWTVDGPNPGTLNLRWTETGGPVVSVPTRKGFGSKLIERNLSHDLDGQARIDYRPEGVVCSIVSTLESVGGGGA